MDTKEIESKFSNSSNFYYGHGIGGYNQNVIDSIFKNGLRCSHGQLEFTTLTLGQGSPTLFQENEELINNWQHKGSRQIIIASLPKAFHVIDVMGTPLYGKRQAAYCYSISNEQAQELGIGSGLYLKPEFVLGVYDADEKSFTSNEQYYENLPEEEQQKLMADTKRQYIEILKQSGWTLSEYSEILKNSNWDGPLTAEEIQKGDEEIFAAQRLDSQLSQMADTTRFSDFDETANTMLSDAQKQQDEEKTNPLEGWDIDDDW